MINALLRLFHRIFPSREEYIITTVLSQRTTSNGDPMSFRDSRGICKSRLHLLTEGLLTETESTAVSILAQGKGRPVRLRLWCYSPKLNLKKLNRGNKGLVELFEEINKREAELRLRSDGRVWRLANRVRVFIRDASGRYWLTEIGRKYYNAEPTYAKKKYAVSGSIQNVELSRIARAAQREVHQELKIWFPLDAFKLEPPSVVAHGDGEHESHAYAMLLSINRDHDFFLIVDDAQMEEWRKNAPVIDDNRVTVYTAVEVGGMANLSRHNKEVHLSPKESTRLKELMRIDTE